MVLGIRWSLRIRDGKAGTMEDKMTNSQLLVILEATKIISELSDSKETFAKYIERMKGEIKKPAETPTASAD